MRRSRSPCSVRRWGAGDRCHLADAGTPGSLWPRLVAFVVGSIGFAAIFGAIKTFVALNSRDGRVLFGLAVSTQDEDIDRREQPRRDEDEDRPRPRRKGEDC